MSEAPGWYPDPYFGGRERYWDGGEWTEQCRASDTKEHQASAKPRTPLNPERATPSAVAAKFAGRAGGGGLATMARPEAREAEAAATPSWNETPPPPPPREPATTIAEGTTAWPTDTGWTIGAAATAAGSADTWNVPPPTHEPPGPPTDAVPAFEEPTDHTEEILSHTAEVPGVVDDGSRLTPEEPTLTEEVLDETEEPLAAAVVEEPTLTEEVLDETEAPAAAAPVAEEPTLTEEVLDEPPPPIETEPEDAPVPVAAAPTRTEEEFDETEEPVAAAVIEAPPTAAAVVEAIDHHPTEPAPARLAETDDSGARGPEPEADSGKHDKAPRPRRRRRTLVGAGVAVVLVVVIVAAASLVKGGGGGGSTSSQQVAHAASATIGEQYAAVSIDTNVPKGQTAAAGVVSGFSGSGTFDFATSLGNLSLSGPGNNGSEVVVVDGSTLYLEPGTVVGQLIPGKSWVSATADDLGTNGTPTGFAVAPTLFVQLVGSPMTLLQQLEAKGVTASAAGSLIYQGTPVEKYTVSLSQAAVAVRQNGVPSSLQDAVVTSPVEHVYVANGLVRAIKVPFDVKSNGMTATGTLAVGFTSWGDSADIAAPASDQVASWAQLKATLTYANALK